MNECIDVVAQRPAECNRKCMRTRVMVALHLGATTPTTQTNGSVSLYRFLRLLEFTSVYYNASIRCRCDVASCLPPNLTNLTTSAFACYETNDIFVRYFGTSGVIICIRKKSDYCVILNIKHPF